MMRQTRTLGNRRAEISKVLACQVAPWFSYGMGRTLQPGDLITTQEAIELLRVSRRTLQRWQKTERLVPFRTPGGDKRYRLADIEAAITDRVAQ